MKYKSSNTNIVHELEFDQTNSKKRYPCPECAGSSKRKRPKDLQYYMETKTAYCFKCETTLFEYKPHENTKQYVVPEWKNTTKLTDRAVKWFTGRMISQDTLNKMEICSSTEYMPQFQKEIEVICFPMKIEGIVKNVKYRGPEKSFKLFSGAELIWYNYDAILKSNEIVIVEGEIDLLTWIENGYENVISVPNGANKNLEYLDNSIHAFDHLNKIYLACDQDTKGIELRDELIRRLGIERCSIINFKQYKDSNEYFVKEGGLSFKELLNTAKEVPVKGAVKIESMYNDIIDLFEKGIQPGKAVKISNIDEFCTWETGRLAICTGNPGSGKSEFVDFVVSLLNLNHGWKAAYFTPENYPLKYHYSKIHEKFSGKKFSKDYGDADFSTVFEHLKDNLFYVLDEEDMSLKKILEVAKMYIVQHGIKVLVIDPYNKLDHNIEKGLSETQYISKFLDELIRFTKFNDILTFLVAHPSKMQRGEVPTLYNISGSAHFYNKADYGFTVHRVRDENDLMTNEVDVYWQKIRFKNLGKQGISNFKYNYNNGRFEQLYSTVDQWDNSNWLIKKLDDINFEQIDKIPF